MEKVIGLYNLTKEEAYEIYNQGPEAVVFKLLEMAAALREISEKYITEGNEKTELKNSTPSGAIPVYEKENSSRRGKKKPGRKKGHESERREVPLKVDEEIFLRIEYCPECGEKLPESEVTRERYIEDIPKVEPVIKRYIIHRSYCKRCNKIMEPVVTSALPKSNIGVNLMALTAWFHYGLGITINHIIEVLNYHLHFKLSHGGPVQIWKRMRNIFISWYEEIATEGRQSSYLHADETGWRVNGQTHWLWCFTNKELTYYMIDRSRGSPALCRFFKDVFRGVLITDFWRAYKKVSSFHQTCYAHLFREIDKVTEKNKSEEWINFRKKLIRWMRDAMRLDKNEDMPAETKDARKQRLHMRLTEFISDKFADKDCLRIQKN